MCWVGLLPSGSSPAWARAPEHWGPSNQCRRALGADLGHLPLSRWDQTGMEPEARTNV